MSAGSSASNLGYGDIAPFSNSNGNFINKFSENNPAFFSSNQIPGMQGLPGLGGAKLNTDAANGIVPGLCSFKGGAKGFKRKIKNITKRYKMGKSKKSFVNSFTNSVTKGVKSVTKGVKSVTKGVKSVTKGVKSVTKGVKSGVTKGVKNLNVNSLTNTVKKSVSKGVKSVSKGVTKGVTSVKNLNSLKGKSRSLALQFSGGKGRKTRTHRRRQKGGYSQYQNNQPFNNTYSTGGNLSPSDSALASPVPIDKVFNQAIDNYNAFTNRGFPSQGH
jgi:hypothetical protein